MARVLGIGGIFFKSPDPVKLYAWYQEHLGMPSGDDGVAFALDRVPPGAVGIFGAFPEDTRYFEPSYNAFMFNLMVDDLEQAVAQVEAGGADIIGD